MKILIVEDDYTSLELMRNILKSYGECSIAVNGSEALGAFSLAWEEHSPYDLICMDIMMPSMNGLDSVREIRRMEENMDISPAQRVKIIITSALGDPANIHRGLADSGADSYLIKPITVTKLTEQVESIASA